jgi:hypothetical protein
MSTLKTGKVKTTTIADELDTESTAVTNVINGSAKAWVNFNGTGTVAIRRGFNVSSITDNGTGDYTVNFATAMIDANYAVNAISLPTFDFRERMKIFNTGGYSSTAFGIANSNAGDTNTHWDSTIIAVTVFS